MSDERVRCRRHAASGANLFNAIVAARIVEGVSGSDRGVWCVQLDAPPLEPVLAAVDQLGDESELVGASCHA